MNVDHMTTSPGFRGYASVSTCPSEKASDILKCIAEVNLSVFTMLQTIVVQAFIVQGHEKTTNISNKLLLFFDEAKAELNILILGCAIRIAQNHMFEAFHADPVHSPCKNEACNLLAITVDHRAYDAGLFQARLCKV